MAIFTLPVGILIAILVMQWMGINANIMSLGGIAIAIGVMVDASVVMVENAHKHLERDKGKKSHQEIILSAAKEVGPALFYSLLESAKLAGADPNAYLLAAAEAILTDPTAVLLPHEFAAQNPGLQIEI